MSRSVFHFQFHLNIKHNLCSGSKFRLLYLVSIFGLCEVNRIFFSHHDDWVMGEHHLSLIRGHHLAYSDLYASSCILPEFDPWRGSPVYFPIFPPSPSLPLRFWTCHLTWSVTMPTCTCNMYHTIQNVWLWWINHQSLAVTQVPVIYHLGNILIALWHNSYAREIRFTVELQFYQKLHRDYKWSPSSGE